MNNSIIIAPALSLGDIIYPSHKAFSGTAYETILKVLKTSKSDCQLLSGYVDQHNKFYDPLKAMKLIKENNQLTNIDHLDMLTLPVLFTKGCKIISPAVSFEDKIIVTPTTCSLLPQLDLLAPEKRSFQKYAISGFIDQNGKFYNPKEALLHVKVTNQVLKSEPYTDELKPQNLY